MNILQISPCNKNESIKEYAYRIIRENILNMVLTPGTKISEKEISDELSISRTPVREAFIRLSQQALVEIFPQRGTYISKINTNQIIEFKFLRLTLDQAVMKLACKNFPENMKLKLQHCLAEQEICVKTNNYDQFFELDNKLHCLIFTGCEKPNIWKIIQEANLNYVRSRILDLRTRQTEINLLFKQHQTLVEAIIQNDEQLGYETITEHINKVIGDINSLKQKYPTYYE